MPDGGNLALRFYGATPGITYRVATGTNPRDWIPEGVTLGDPGPDGTRTATVARDAPQRFLRLVVE